MPLLSRQAVLPLIRLALREDAAGRDVTSRAVLPSAARIRARIIAKSPGILAGGQVAAWTFHAVDPRLRCVRMRRDGAAVARGQTILTVEGRARSIFAAERTALNFLGHLCGIATLTRQFVRRAGSPRVTILDTRKTLPGLRALQKRAVAVGGGANHRMGLQDAVLIKTNHIRAAHQSIPQLVRKAQRTAHGRCVEVEVRNLTELRAALTARPNAILLDNWTMAAIRQAIRFRGTQPAARGTTLEVSGGVTLANVRRIAKTGVDRISIGRLTHSAPALDVSLEVL